jgi:hypothetical protein
MRIAGRQGRQPNRCYRTGVGNRSRWSLEFAQEDTILDVCTVDRPSPGFAANDCAEIIGDEMTRTVNWKHGSDVRKLAGQAVRLRFELKDTGLYSFRFTTEHP